MVERVVTWVVISGGYGMTLWLIKRWIGDLKAEVEEVKKNQINCQLSLPEKYAGIGGVGRLSNKLDHVAGDVEYLKGKYNGRS